MAQRNPNSRLSVTDIHYVEIVNYLEEERQATELAKRKAEIAAMRAQERLHAANYMLRAARQSLDQVAMQNHTLRESATGAIRCVDELYNILRPFFATHTQLAEDVQAIMLRSDTAFAMMMNAGRAPVDLTGDTTEEE